MLSVFTVLTLMMVEEEEMPDRQVVKKRTEQRSESAFEGFE